MFPHLYYHSTEFLPYQPPCSSYCSRYFSN